MRDSSTIAAVSTPPGLGAVALVRMSGPCCREILARCWKGRAVESFVPRKAYLGAILTAEGEKLDEALVTWFQAPNSYTGDDTLEVACHGGVLVVRRVLEQLFACGAAPAGPGEFTRRAFINGKMDLTQAEAVMDILSAQSDLALKAAQDQLEGSLGRSIQEQTSEVLDLVAHVEAHIDFPDEDISPGDFHRLASQAEKIDRALSSLLSTSDCGRLLREGVGTALVGAPNVGKSSLLNLLLGYERAIISETPGTTRDTLEETINLGGFALRLIDTAGIREADDLIEKAGIERTERAVSRADLVLEVVDASLPRRHVLTGISQAPHLLILNKTDLGIHPEWKESGGIVFSCKTGEGEEALVREIANALGSTDASEKGAAVIAINTRHQHCLRLAQQSLRQAIYGLGEMMSPEFVALDLREALNYLGEITGRVDTEDVLGRIFSSFCIGK